MAIKVEVDPRLAEVAIEVETSLNPAVVEDRSLAEHNHHAVEVLPNLEDVAGSMHRQWPHRVNNLQSAVGSHRAIGRLRSASRILADSPESQLLRQSRFVPDRAHELGTIRTTTRTAMGSPGQSAAEIKACEAMLMSERRRAAPTSVDRGSAISPSLAIRSTSTTATSVSDTTRTNRRITGTPDITAIGTAIGATGVVQALGMDRVQGFPSTSVALD